MKRIHYYLFLLAAMIAPQACSSDRGGTPALSEGEEFYFFDDFDTFDESVWTKETHEPGWVNQELQAYDPAQVTVGKDGDKTVLILTAEHRNGKIVSGRVNSQGKMNFRLRKVEASIRLPKTDAGLWPAFWMMGDNSMEWPKCGEIDIMEMGEKAGIADGTSETWMNSAIHYGNSPEDHRQEYHAANVAASLQDGNYHTYTLDWTENSLTVSVDGNLFHTFDISKMSGRYDYFHGDCYVLFNLAVGGAFPGITDADGITALKEGEKACMYVDWIKVY